LVVEEAVWCVRIAGRSVRYEVFTAGEELLHVGDELLTVATAFDLVYVYVRNNILCDIHECDPPCAYKKGEGRGRRVRQEGKGE